MYRVIILDYKTFSLNASFVNCFYIFFGKKNSLLDSTRLRDLLISVLSLILDRLLLSTLLMIILFLATSLRFLSFLSSGSYCFWCSLKGLGVFFITRLTVCCLVTRIGKSWAVCSSRRYHLFFLKMLQSVQSFLVLSWYLRLFGELVYTESFQAEDLDSRKSTWGRRDLWIHNVPGWFLCHSRDLLKVLNG